jgi:hypothetical protein
MCGGRNINPDWGSLGRCNIAPKCIQRGDVTYNTQHTPCSFLVLVCCRGRGAAAYSTGVWGDEDDGDDGSGSAYATPGPDGGDEDGEDGDMYSAGGRGGKRKVHTGGCSRRQ